MVLRKGDLQGNLLIHSAQIPLPKLEGREPIQMILRCKRVEAEASMRTKDLDPVIRAERVSKKEVGKMQQLK